MARPANEIFYPNGWIDQASVVRLNHGRAAGRTMQRFGLDDEFRNIVRVKNFIHGGTAAGNRQQGQGGDESTRAAVWRHNGPVVNYSSTANEYRSDFKNW